MTGSVVEFVTRVRDRSGTLFGVGETNFVDFVDQPEFSSFRCVFFFVRSGVF